MSVLVTAEGRPGRPRHSGQTRPASPRDEILDHAARLFTTRGYAGTSTRDIAEAVGLRQASIYYYFQDKGGILCELLQQTIRPTYDRVERIETLADEHGWATVLYVLVLVDVDTLASAPHNAGILTRLPDVTSQPLYAKFIAARRELADAYQRIGGRVGDSEWVRDLRLGDMLLQLVEVVISMRRGGAEITDLKRSAIATSALRVCGVPDAKVLATADTAKDLVDQYL